MYFCPADFVFGPKINVPEQLFHDLTSEKDPVRGLPGQGGRLRLCA
jgi:hypothetical protein